MASGDRVWTTNDSGDIGRVFTVDAATGETVGTTYWADGPRDVEALAPAGPGRVWVGDIGDNSGSRDSIEVTRVPVGDGDRTVDEETIDLVYPDGPRDAEALLVDPTTGRILVVTKGVFAGEVYAAPPRDGRRRPQPARAGRPGRRAGHRRRLLPRRSPRRAADLLARRRSTPSPSWSRSAPGTCPRSSRARASPSPRTAGCS